MFAIMMVDDDADVWS